MSVVIGMRQMYYNMRAHQPWTKLKKTFLWAFDGSHGFGGGGGDACCCFVPHLIWLSLLLWQWPSGAVITVTFSTKSFSRQLEPNKVYSARKIILCVILWQLFPLKTAQERRSTQNREKKQPIHSFSRRMRICHFFVAFVGCWLMFVSPVAFSFPCHCFIRVGFCTQSLRASESSHLGSHAKSTQPCTMILLKFHIFIFLSFTHSAIQLCEFFPSSRHSFFSFSGESSLCGLLSHVSDCHLVCVNCVYIWSVSMWRGRLLSPSARILLRISS